MISNSNLQLPEDLLCPILQEVMTDPVVAADGHTYQRESITEWINRGNRRSPLNGNQLAHTIIIDNILVKKLIIQFQSKLSKEIQEAGIRSNLEMCIKQKEELIQSLIDKFDNININKHNTTTDVILDLKKENINLKKLIIELEENNIQLLEKIKDIV